MCSASLRPPMAPCTPIITNARPSRTNAFTMEPGCSILSSPWESNPGIRCAPFNLKDRQIPHSSRVSASSVDCAAFHCAKSCGAMAQFAMENVVRRLIIEPRLAVCPHSPMLWTPCTQPSQVARMVSMRIFKGSSFSPFRRMSNHGTTPENSSMLALRSMIPLPSVWRATTRRARLAKS